MKKIRFEEWKNNYKDILFLEKNFPEMEDYGVDVAQIKEKNQSYIIDNPNQCVTKTVRVFLYGGYYEIDNHNKYQLVLENNSWWEEKPDLVEKELFDWCNGEYFNQIYDNHYDENGNQIYDPYGLESVTDDDYDENGNWRHE